MPLTLAQMLALLPDNTTGLISAADMRDVVTAIVHGQRAPYSLDNADDVWWEGDSAGMTQVTVTGSETISEVDGLLSVKFSGQASNDLNALLKAHSFSVGDAWAVSMRMIGPGSNFTFGGLVFTDGTATTSNVIYIGSYMDGGEQSYFAAYSGTLTNVSTNINNVGSMDHAIVGVGYYKLTYQASNTFRLEYSADGITWITMGSDASKTMTPTHVGVVWSRWAGADTGDVSYGPLCKLA